jgi:hypothetical protein
VHLLNKGSEKISRYNLATCAIRVIQVLASSENCVLAMVKANVVPVIVKSIRPPQRDAAFTLETLKIMLKTGAAKHLATDDVVDCVGNMLLLPSFIRLEPEPCDCRGSVAR